MNKITKESKENYIIGATYLVTLILSLIFVFYNYNASECLASISQIRRFFILFLASGIFATLIFAGLAGIYTIYYCIKILIKK